VPAAVFRLIPVFEGEGLAAFEKTDRLGFRALAVLGVNALHEWDRPQLVEAIAEVMRPGVVQLDEIAVPIGGAEHVPGKVEEVSGPLVGTGSAGDDAGDQQHHHGE
jgi:hypothetical protein